MQIRELSIAGAWEFTPTQFGDDRGLFLEAFKSTEFEKATGRSLDLCQVNCSVSAAGVLRGIHFTDDPPGQGKYVTCVRGAFFDVVVDVRPDSPTFGQWDGVLLDDVDRRAVFLSEGLGHAVLSLADESTLLYLCTLEYTPELDHDLDALDPAIAIAWPGHTRSGAPLTLTRSPKDAAAPPLSSLM
ncbi:MAG: dTDP-4-dehydrorhamnose 3,5-epimerase family protein [Mycobacteriaceae bacterium]|nr:dTDP-4-dehydrorhamnose 3,5-epimerase family protein [Mycobacteriaceae bacterium]